MATPLNLGEGNRAQSMARMPVCFSELSVAAQSQHMAVRAKLTRSLTLALRNSARPLSLVGDVKPLAAPMRVGDALARWLGHQRWLRYGVRYQVLRRWSDPTCSDAHLFEAPFAGFVYGGDLSRWIDWIVYYFGVYEEDELELLRSVMSDRPDAVALDIGANVGHHTLYLASFCSEVHAFEPFAPLAKSIRDKVERNSLSGVHVHPLGLGDSDVELPYFAPADHNIGNGTFVAANAPHPGAPDCMLSVRQGDRYIESLLLRRVDLIKIDVEGFELEVLAGVRQTLRQYRPIVMLELNDASREKLGSEDAFRTLLPPDYRTQRLVRPMPVATFFSRRSARLEPVDWSAGPTPGGYMNLLLSPLAG